MLILKRRTGERIIIDDNIVITVQGIDRGYVSLGIDAPKSVEVYREEIWMARNEKARIGQ